MTGVGAHAAAGIGVMRELQKRGVEPYAVCGLHAGAWPAALFAAGLGMQSMEKALHQAAGMGRKMIAPMWYERLGFVGNGIPGGLRLNRLLALQTGQRILSLCPGAAVFPCRMIRTGQRVLFSTRAYMPDPGPMLSMQASACFAARAAMGLSPFLAPLEYMGSALMGETDVAFSCRQLMLLGAQRVLVIAPVPPVGRVPDALDLCASVIRFAGERPLGGDVGVLRVTMPEGALSLSRLEACALAGEKAASQELDMLFDCMGMAHCRVLAFRKRSV